MYCPHMFKTFIFLFVVTMWTGFASANQSEWRRLSNGKGGGISARIVAVVSESKILIENSTGQRFETPLEVFTKEDREWVTEWRKWWDERTEVAAKLNEAIGHPVFNAAWRLWDEESKLVAERLQLPQESETPYSSSFRLYAGDSYRFLAARPYSVAAYGDDQGRFARMSLVFSNKGDSFSSVGSGEDHFREGENGISLRNFEDMIKYDAKTLTESLTAVLGEGETQYYGEANNRRRIVRWDWNSHAFILSEEDDEYVGLLIVSVEEAENRGRTDRIPDSEIKKRLAANVVREENGDVYVKNIPMVDQGPKGYCVPATFERAMRYQGVPADMYLLAIAGGTQPGGGTYTQELYDEVKSIIRRKGRRPDDIKTTPLKMRTVKRYIDEGVPIMWQMCSLDLYNKIANRRSQERRDVTDWEAYGEKIAEEASSNAKLLEDVEANHHVCMIIGYNEETEEVAVSDSWGARYAIRWVHFEEAAAVSNGQGFAIKR